MQESFCHIGNFEEVNSELTGRSLLVNMSETHFQIPVTADVARVREISLLHEDHWRSLSLARHPTGVLLEALSAFAAVQSLENYCDTVDRLIAVTLEIDRKAKTKKVLRGAKARTMDLLMRLWSEHLIAWPTLLPFETASKKNHNEWTLQAHLKWFNEISAACASTSPIVRARNASMVLRSATTTVGIVELGDLVPLSLDMKRWKWLDKSYPGALKCVMVAQQQHYGKAAVFPSDRWTKHLTGSVVDNSFSWAIERNAELKDWAQLFSTWIENATANLVMRRTAAMHFLNYLLEFSGSPPNPLQYCRRDYHTAASFVEWLDSKHSQVSLKHRSKLVNILAEFFDGLLATKLTLEDDFGRPVVSPEHYNPVTRVIASSVRAQTHREAMPIRYINELVGILTENDFEWPKRHLTDYFSCYNEAEGHWERIWSPVRAIALLIKLHLPLRTFQVRMLDSGECDHAIYRAGAWIPNSGPLASTCPQTEVLRGFLRRFEDRKVKRTFTGFYINTNKTADRMKDPEDRGYEIPWQHDMVIAWAEMLRDWQLQYNAVGGPMNWGEVNERELRRMYSKDSLAARGEVTFLFRDPCAPDRRYPVRASRLTSMWNQLLDELEQRVFARGERLPDGSKIIFVKTRAPSGTPSSPVYDLHTLRVSLLTAYATDGGVPIEILSKCVAGHASILMTMYYIKTGPAYITEQFALAQERIAAKEKDNLLRFMMDAQLAQIQEAVAFNDSSATQAIMETNPGSWVVNDKGICPVGGNRCSVGGPKVTNMDCRASDYSPVPGGAKNCVRCRFFITGPAFLGGMVAHFNAIGIKLMEATRRYREQGTAIQTIEDEMLVARQTGNVFLESKKLDLAYERQDQLLKEVDELALGWHDAYKLIERCKAIIATTPSEQGVSLVLAGTQRDLEVAIELTSDFEVINAVCQVANVYPAEDSTVANLRRSRILDAMLARNSCKPVFATLTGDEALRVGNEFVNFLQARLGRVDTKALMEGTRMLGMSGMTNDVHALLEKLTGQSMHFSSLVDAQPGISQLLSSEAF